MYPHTDDYELKYQYELAVDLECQRLASLTHLKKIQKISLFQDLINSEMQRLSKNTTCCSICGDTTDLVSYKTQFNDTRHICHDCMLIQAASYGVHFE